jgi:hypothetical protein
MIMSSILPLAHLNVKFVLDGKNYGVEGFTMDFRQPVDYKSQPQHEILGGQMMITLPQAADKSLYAWAKTSTMLKSGTVLFQTDLGMTVLEIKFENAYCIQLLRETTDSTGTKTNMIISPRQVSLNGIEHLNRWPG